MARIGLEVEIDIRFSSSSFWEYPLLLQNILMKKLMVGITWRFSSFSIYNFLVRQAYSVV